MKALIITLLMMVCPLAIASEDSYDSAPEDLSAICAATFIVAAETVTDPALIEDLHEAATFFMNWTLAIPVEQIKVELRAVLAEDHDRVQPLLIEAVNKCEELMLDLQK